MNCGSEKPTELKQLQRQSRHVQKCLSVVKNLSENVVMKKRLADEFKLVEILQTLDGILKEMKQVALNFLSPQTIWHKKLYDDLEFKNKHSNCEELSKRYRTLFAENKELEQLLKIYMRKCESEASDAISMENQIEDLEDTVTECFKQKDKLCKRNKELSQLIIEINSSHEKSMQDKNKEIEELRLQLKILQSKVKES